MRTTVSGICAAFVLLCGTVSVFLFFILDYAKHPASQKDDRQVSVTIASGHGFKSVSNQLFEQGLIRKKALFDLFARIKGYDRKIKAGEYALSASMTPADILEKLSKGEVILHRLSVPEGYTVMQIALLVEQQGVCSRDKFMQAAGNAEFIKALRLPSDSLEGYLFPDTYHYSKNTSCRDLIRLMVKRFKSVLTDPWKARAEQIGFTVHQVVTLASIIEKETGAAEERPLIASVFHNRLKGGMRLESDPTVIYGIENFDGNLTRKHLKTLTPYNTYMIKGLPPHPIANPGKASLEAALYPADTDYLFFVSRNDGTHVFSKNYSDHLQAVKKYQLNQ